MDPHKVQAVPTPEDGAAVQRLLGFVQYLSKFMPHLSDLTKPLRELTQKEIAWHWGTQQEALETIKKNVTKTPVLRYYNVKEEVTLQCDASQFGLGAALMQNGQPASRARYAQIEKELLAIVFACEHFEYYIYGRGAVNVETDHQLLVPIVLKPLNKATNRLQRMLLRLQNFNLNVKYKKGQDMFLADTLSRAFLPAGDFALSLEEVDHTMTLAIPEDQLQELARQDPVSQALSSTIRQGWPNSKSEVAEIVHPYFDVRDELTVQDDLVYSLRRRMMEVAHETHIGMEGCLRRARECS